MRRERLAETVRSAAVAHMVRQGVVRDIRAALDESGVPVVFLKGVALAEQVYPRPALRLSSDIDAWIRPDDLNTAIEALSRIGFVVPARHREPSDPRGPVPITYLEATVAGRPILIDLHVRPGSLRHLTDDEVLALWATRTVVGPSSLPVLPLDAQLLHVCLHVARSHAFVGGLKALVDVALIVRAWPDGGLWRSLGARARALHAETSTFACLELARRLLGVEIPDEVLDQLDRGDSRSIIDQATRMLWSGEPKLPLGVVILAGGGVPEPGRIRNRLMLRQGITPQDRRDLSLVEHPPARMVARYVLRRATSLARLMARGELFRLSLWRRIGVERRRSRLLRELMRVEGRPRG